MAKRAKAKARSKPARAMPVVASPTAASRIAFGPDDMRRRNSRSVAMAIALLAFVAMVFITSLYEMKAGWH